MLKEKRIVLGVTGGIAAYKAAEIVSRLTRRGACVRVVMTANACKFLAPLTLETLSGNPVLTDTFGPRENLAHISLAKWADLFLIAPATANILGKLAGGIADDLLSTTAMAMRCPIWIAPAMNNNMWNSRANQRNVQTLREWGVQMVGPARGRLACGDEDVGRMADPEEIVRAVEDALHPLRDFVGKRVLVTAGPTIERIDPVRYITNRSTGKMGYALCEAARDRGAEVTLVSGPVHLQRPAGVEFYGIESSRDLAEKVLELSQRADVVIQAAAPADFRPRQVSAQKIKKTGEGMSLELENTLDIASALGSRKREGQILVAFAAETENHLQNARRKLEKKNADLVVLNDVSRADAGFAADTNQVTLVTREKSVEVALDAKRAVADRVLDCIAGLLKQ
ncbi:MAG TPA: bifunctional phosphopantothenoylcysteine decarboxylase/phosphopantothenate--cysteine ligase CoaBC [Candidatus Pullichristensenella excrementigallinarum]|uniref:Coenzyme A biosynthesis bifunctional protein CoaBC n=1 Tax=Candidatus Pullichristensenella excrementigallinarum TaxID=2840907 RepID=A0A9D1I9R3_9FIRM|nr:bifunctional phosphopantothenoylcysteine decarboxylase/phosphopantothenate--cysteine ligase CoaBC [Candidatus Pullichristensenella excrementigallinarum]